MYFFRNKFSCFDNLQLLGISVQFFNAEFMLRSITQKFLSINSPLNNFWVLKKWLHNYQEITTFNKWKSVKFLLPTKKIPSYICIHTYMYTHTYICIHTYICYMYAHTYMYILLFGENEKFSGIQNEMNLCKLFLTCLTELVCMLGRNCAMVAKVLITYKS